MTPEESSGWCSCCLQGCLPFADRESGLCQRCFDNRTRTQRSWSVSPECPNCPDREFAKEQARPIQWRKEK